MRPERRSQLLLGVTRSKAKMYEYDVPEEHHIKIKQDPAKLFTLAIGLLGDLSARINSEVINEDYLKELRETLLFSARFFDAYLESRLNHEYDPYLLLLGAASYYLCNLPGSSLVLAKRLGKDCPDLECMGLEDLLLWLLQGDLFKYFDETEGVYGKYIDGISQGLTHFFKYGSGQESLFEKTANLRRTVYDNGTPRQLLFGDIICAVAKRRFENSTWHCLPQYSHLSPAQWMDILQKETFIRELWPAQHLLGEHGIFRGKSAVVQMPTSAGKTKATEIIIRSSFIANRTSLAVIVAPFRALCHEIRNSFVKAFQSENVSVDELSDVLQADYAIAEFLGRKQVLVVTPEKLIYVLRHTPELAENIGLLIYDEGHQFDSGTRGITYELLLTSLKTMVPEDAQTVLISAVISNAPAVGKWINGEESEVVSGATLTPTYRTVAFASWLDQLGRLEFVTQDNPDNEEFFVPRIISQYQLQLKGKERKHSLFPEKTDGQAIALYLGLKLVGNGSVAIFCGRKSTASSLCEKVVSVFDREVNLKEPTEFSDKEEVHRLHFLHECNLGTNSIATKSAALGIFSHHGNTPQGIRLAVEHAMKQGYAKFVICTSTLAQGVNLPIRYLIVTGVYQGTERIKVRDFHNLIGRAGRAGMHTEGSILFADPVVYDKRTNRADKWRWEQVKELLDPSKSEPCASTLLSIFEPLKSDDRKYTIPMEPLGFVNAYIQSAERVAAFPGKIAEKHADKGFTKEGLLKQVEWKINIISSIESYLMAHWNESDTGLNEEDVSELATGTLAYFLSDEEQQKQIIELFKLLARNIEQSVADASRRTIYGKTLYGVRTSIEIEAWVTEHLDRLVLCVGHDDLLATLWPIIAKNIQNNTVRKCDQPEILKDVALGWISGKPYHELFNILSDADARLIAGTQRRQFKLDHIVEICENAFAYDGTLVLGAVAELIELIRQEDCAELVSKTQELQKRLKYGLPFSTEITLYEMGFSDRAVSQDLGAVIDVISSHRQVVVQAIKQHKKVIRETLRKYPSYFQMVLESIVG
jgi:hypothetical protein